MADKIEDLGFQEIPAIQSGIEAMSFTPTQFVQRGQQQGGLFGQPQQLPPGLIDIIKSAHGVKPFLRETFEPPAATAAGGLMELKRLAESLPRQQVSTGIFPQRLADIPEMQPAQQKAQQLLSGLMARRPEQAQTGKTLADIVAFGATEEAAAPIVGALGLGGEAVGIGKKILGRTLSGFPAGAAISPEHRIFGGLAGAATAAAPEAATAALKVAPKLTLGGLGKATLNAYDRMREIGHNLYNQVFEGVGHIKTQLSDETDSAIQDLKDTFGKTSQIRKAIDIYEKNPTLQGMHDLKSAIGEEYSSNVAAIKKGGAAPSIKDAQPLLKTAQKSLAKDTREYLGIISPEKQALYDKAQAHWAKNVVPFREFPVIRTLTGGRRIAKPGLFREFGEKVIPREGAPETPTEALRRIVEMPRSAAQVGRALHHRIGGLPLGGWLGIGGTLAGTGELLRRYL